MKPLISVITVTYNPGAELLETLESLYSQIFSDFEHIIIDGHGSDVFPEIPPQLKARLSYFVSEPDGGIYDAMNKGLKQASGQYVQFMNAGDVYSDSMSLEKVSIAAKTDPDVIYGDINLVNEKGEIITPVFYDEFNTKNLLRYGTGTVNHQAFFIKKQIAPFFSNEYRYKGELNWYYDILEQNQELRSVHIKFPLVNYVRLGTAHRKFKENLMEMMSIVYRRFGIFTFLRYSKLYWKYIHYLFIKHRKD